MRPLSYKVTLKGAKAPKDYFYIRHYPPAVGKLLEIAAFFCNDCKEIFV